MPEVCLGGESQAKLLSRKDWPAVDFPLSKQPSSFLGTLTTFSWARLFCVPVAVQISILSAPGVFPHFACVALPVEMSLHPRKCH